MEVYGLDPTNIESFDFLVEPAALQAVKREEAYGFCVKTDGAHVGALVGRFVDNNAYEIMSLFVLPEYRKRGVGEKLLDTLKEVLADQNAEVSISFACMSKDEKELMRFLEDNGFEEYRSLDSHIFSVTVGDLLKSKLFHEKGSAGYPCFDDLSEKHINALDNLTGEGFIPKPVGGFSSKRIETEVSTVKFRSDKPVAYAVIERENDDLLVLSSLYVSDKEKPTTLTKLLRSGLQRLTDKYTDDTVLLLPTVNEKTERMFSDLFEGSPEVEDVFYTYKKFFAKAEPNVFEGTLSDFIAEEKQMLDDEETELVYMTK